MFDLLFISASVCLQMLHSISINYDYGGKFIYYWGLWY